MQGCQLLLLQPQALLRHARTCSHGWNIPRDTIGKIVKRCHDLLSTAVMACVHQRPLSR